MENGFAHLLNFKENLFAQVGWDRLSVLDYRVSYSNSRAWVDNILLGGRLPPVVFQKRKTLWLQYFTT